MIIANDPALFFNLQSRFERVPFTQSEAWYNYLKAQGKRMVFLMDNPEEPGIMTWGIVEKAPLSSKEILRIEGECYHDEAAESIRQFYTDLSNSGYVGIELNSNNDYCVDFEVSLRRAGFVRPIGSFSCPLTIFVDLEKAIDYNRNWKRNVKTAIQERLVVREIKEYPPMVIQQITSLFQQMADLKGLGYSLSEKALNELLQSEGVRTFMVFDKDNEPLAARIVHVHKEFAADVIAANSNRARECGAVFLLMQRLFEQLSSEQVRSFDFSRIPPSSHASDSVYLFKNSTRGKKVQYNGEWTFYKRKIIELAIFAYKTMKLKKQRY